MDRLGHSAPPVNELRQIEHEARSSNSLKQLRVYFDRIQELRRIHSNDFDVQLVVAEAQEEIIQRARDLRSRYGAQPEGDVFEDGRGKSSAAADGNPPTAAPAPRIDTQHWRRATLLALVLTAVICIIFFWLIQNARRINLAPPPAASAPAKQGSAPEASNPSAAKVADAPVSTAPVVRLYTDLIPGTVSVDDGDPQDLKDGELVLDHLEPGRHSVKVAGGRNGSAAFSFDVAAGAAPQIVPPLTAANAMAILITSQDGRGRLISSVQQPQVSLDGKGLGEAGTDGLELVNLGTTDHELQIAQGKNLQRFVMTYTAAPALTVYVKSDPYAGTVTIDAKQDGVSVYIDDRLYRRKTDRGQLRIPLKVGQYVIRVHKDGFVDPPPQSVDVKKAEESELSFVLEPAPSLSALEIHSAAPGTAIYLDREQVATADATGNATIAGVKSGEHVIDLRLEGSIPKRLQRRFQAGETVSLAGSDTVLEKAAAESKPAPVEAASPAESAASSAGKAVEIPGEQVRKGGGFVHYNVPKTSGRYSFQAHSKIGGFLKHDKLQWYAGYQNSENYILFSVDGKRATIREVKDGKTTEVNRIPFSAASGVWVQVDLAVKPESISARIRTPDNPSWSDMGSVASPGRDFTQDRVGFYVPGNDEVAVANFRFNGQ